MYKRRLLISDRGGINEKNKIITSVVVMALCSFAIAYAANKSGIIVFILSWIVGMLASILIQYLWSSKRMPAKLLVSITLLISLIAGIIVYSFAFV